MNRSRSRTRPLAGLLCAVLLLAGCAGSNIGAPASDPEPAREAEAAAPVVEPTAEPVLPQARTTSAANVRRAPGTDHPIVFWLHAGTEVTVVGRNADGTWLLIDHGTHGDEFRTGWIFAGLTDLPADRLAALAETTPAVEILAQIPTLIAAGAMPAAETEAAPTVTPEPAPVAEPTPEPEPEPAAEPEPEPVRLTVTGSAVNVREGPGTGHPIALQARAGDQFEVVGRNADGTWLQVADPRTPAGRLWIYGGLTDFDAAAVQALADVGMVEVKVEPEAVAEVRTPEPQAAPSGAGLAPVAGCTQWHTVNPNETRLSQITDWFDLDLATTAALNGIDANAPLTAGARLCLAAGQAEPPPATTGDAGMPADPVALPPGALWWPPGSYADVPGLDYDFEIEWRDESTGWNWQLRDTEGCYDALRAFLEDLPARFGIKKYRIELHDMPVERNLNSYDHGNYSFGGWYAQPKFSLDTVKPLWPDWEGRVRPDQAVAGATCEHLDERDNTKNGVFVCKAFVAWGHPGHLLDGVTIHAIAKNMGHIGFAEDNDGASHWGLFAWDRQAYLTPVMNQLVVGHGACLHLTKQE